MKQITDEELETAHRLGKIAVKSIDGEILSGKATIALCGFIFDTIVKNSNADLETKKEMAKAVYHLSLYLVTPYDDEETEE